MALCATGLGLRWSRHGPPGAAAPAWELAAAPAGALSGPQVPRPSAGRHRPAGNAGRAGAWAGPRMPAGLGDHARPGGRGGPAWPAATAGVAAATARHRARTAALVHRTCPDTLPNTMCHRRRPIAGRPSPTKDYGSCRNPVADYDAGAGREVMRHADWKGAGWIVQPVPSHADKSSGRA